MFSLFKREKKNVHITFNLWRSFPLLLEILDLLCERVCMVCVNIVGYRKKTNKKTIILYGAGVFEILFCTHN